MTSTPIDPSTVSTPTPDGRPSDRLLIQRFRSGDQSAAAALFGRYVRRVQTLARSSCTPSFAARFDDDDIVQTVFRVLFHGIRESAYDVPSGGDLWGLLRVLTVNKIRGQVDHHGAAKRNVRRTARIDDSGFPQDQLPESHALDYLQVVLDDLITGLSATERDIVTLRIEGHSLDEIAARSGVSRRTAERILHDFRTQMGDLDPDG